jgi:hypothetical protein
LFPAAEARDLLSRETAAMSFKFHWPEFSEEMYAMVRTELTKALNSGERHPSLADDIVTSEIHFGNEV